MRITQASRAVIYLFIPRALQGLMHMARAQEAEARGGREGGQHRVRAGAGAGLQPLHAAWRALLDTWLPALLEECNFAASFLQLYEPPANVDADAEGARAPSASAAQMRPSTFNRDTEQRMQT